MDLCELECVSMFYFLYSREQLPQMIAKLILTLAIALVLATASADDKPQRIADSIQVMILTPPLFRSNVTLDITQESTLYLLPQESASLDYSTAFSFYGSNRQWIWNFNGAVRQYPQPAWYGNVNSYNPLEYPKATMQLKLRNSVGEIVAPVVTVTMLVSPRITTALPETLTVTEGEEFELSVGVNTDQRTSFTWGVNNHTIGDNASKIKFIPTMDMDGKTLGVLALNPMGVATSTTTLTVKMAPWKIAVIVIFVVLAVGGIAAGAFFFLKKKGIIGKKSIEYVNTPTPLGNGADDNGLLESNESV